MTEPFRLGVSGSCFFYVMPKELLVPSYAAGLKGKIRKFDEQQNEMMADFMRDMMRVYNTMDIDAIECYHSLTWDNEKLLEVILDEPKVDFWSVHAPYGLFVDPSSPVDEAREGAVAGYGDAINLAARLDAKVVVSHPGTNNQYDVSKEKRLEYGVETFKKIADHAGEHGLKIAIEPMPKQEPGNSLDEVFWLIDRIDRPNVGINFDVNHLFPPENMPNLIRKAGNLIQSVHISDQDGEERHWLPFQGTLPWQDILTALTETGYAGPLVYETHIREAKSCDEVGHAVVENYKRLIQMTPGLAEANR